MAFLIVCPFFKSIYSTCETSLTESTDVEVFELVDCIELGLVGSFLIIYQFAALMPIAAKSLKRLATNNLTKGVQGHVATEFFRRGNYIYAYPI